MIVQIEPFIRYQRFQRSLSERTLDIYRSELTRFAAHVNTFGIADWRAVTADHIVTFLQPPASLAPATVQLKHVILRVFFRYLVEQEKIRQDPVPPCPKFKNDKRDRPEFLKIEDVINLIESAPIPKTYSTWSDFYQLRMRLVLEMLYSTGCRRAEIHNIDIQDIDLAGGAVRVTGKGSKDRIVPLGTKAKLVLEIYLNVLADWGRDSPNRPLFINKDGTRLGMDMIGQMVKKAAHQAGLPATIHPHLLRHTFATHILNGGCDLRTVQELMGHSNIATTCRYTHVTNGEKLKKFKLSHPRA